MLPIPTLSLLCSYLAMTWKDPAPPNDPYANETGTITVYERNNATKEYTRMCTMNITAGALDGECAAYPTLLMVRTLS
jgi:hypothetical protein